MSRRVAAPWTLLARFLPVLAFVACQGDDPQIPTTLAPSTAAATTGSATTAVVGTAVAAPPTVTLQDQRGHGIAGVWVHWTAAAGSHVTNDSSRTDGAGTALSGGWTLGPTSGTQTLTATAVGLPATVFTVQALAGPVQLLSVMGSTASGVVNTLATNVPSVRAVDQYGNAVAGLAVTFSVVTGGGTLTGAQQTTNADGVAQLGSWTLGTIAGDQTIRADAGTTGISTTLTARVQGGAPVDLVLAEGDAQRGVAGKRLCTSPAVMVRDSYGNGVGQVPITFTSTAGGGSVTGSSAVTDATTGRASVGAWILGSGATETLVATTSVLPGKQVAFTATLGPAPGYAICARFIGDGGTARQREAVTKAVARWQSVITGHVQTTHLTAAANECTDDIPAIDEDVEDLLLYVQLAPIDGPRNIIGQAAPCYVHLPSRLTLMGFLQLDVADLDLMLSQGTLDNVVLHEIGHILGIGTLWNFQRSLLSGRGGADPYFTGAVARDQFALTGSTYSGTPVPVENTGGAGTRDAHWRKTVFNNELMQGYSAPVMPLSRVTIGSLADLGYTVNLDAADPFSLLPALRADIVPDGAALVDDVADTPIWGVDRNGTRTIVRVPTASIRR